MATSKILLGLIAFSSFQVQNARKIRDDISHKFYEAMKDEIIILIVDNKHKALGTAIVELDEFYENMERLETQANSDLQEIHASETCKSRAATVLGGLSSDIRNNVAACYRKLKKEAKETANIARETWLPGAIIKHDLQENFIRCPDNECRKEMLAEANKVKRPDLADKVLADNLKANARLLANFKKTCLIKGEDDYQRLAEEVLDSIGAEICT